MRHIAIESGAYVVSVPQYIPGSAFPADFPAEFDRDHVYGRGGTVIVEPTWGKIIAGPVYDAETVLVADCDLRAGLHAKGWFDAVGHHSRTDVLKPTARLKRAARVPTTGGGCPGFPDTAARSGRTRRAACCGGPASARARDSPRRWPRSASTARSTR
jgi:hypothetical protein